MVDIDTAEYRRWYGLDKPWTGGGDIAFHLGQVLDALDAARAAWGNGECCSTCPHHGFTAAELDGVAPEDLTWDQTFALLHARVEVAEARIASALNRNNYCECGNSASVYSALTGLS